MKICKNTLSFKDKDKSKKSSVNFRKKSSNNISEKDNKLQKFQKTKQKKLKINQIKIL